MLAALPLLGSSFGLTPTETAVIRLLNEARTKPARFAERYIVPREGESHEAAECIREMRRMAPLPPLKIAAALIYSARDHANESGGRWSNRPSRCRRLHSR